MPPKTKTKTDKNPRRNNSESSSNEVKATQKSTPLSKSKHSSDELSVEEPVLYVGKGSPALVEKQPPPDSKEPLMKNLSPHSMALRRRAHGVDASKETMHDIGSNKTMHDIESNKFMHDIGSNKFMHDIGSKETMHDIGSNKFMHDIGSKETMHGIESNQFMHDIGSNKTMHDIGQRRLYGDGSKEIMYGKLQNDSTAGKDSPLYKYIAMLALIVFFAFAFLYIEFERESDVTSAGNRSLIEVRSEMISLAKVLRQTTNQNKDFWIDMLVGLDNLAEEEPRQASILMLAIPKDAENTALCLSQLLAGYVKKSFRDRGPKVVHDTRKFLSLSPSDHKLALDNELQGLNSSHSAIIYNLELMPAETATLLHGYCDNDNAPFKRAIIFLLVEIATPYEDVTLGRLDSFMESFFFKMYGPQLDADHIPGLVSRLTPQVVLVKPESQEVMNRVCV